MSVWRSLSCPIAEVRIDITLACGQSFRWREVNPGQWRSVLAGHIWTLRQNDNTIEYMVHNEQETVKKQDESFYEKILRNYFQLDVSLKELYDHWSEVDKNFKTVASDFVGVRMLRQDPTENLFSFICSSNNHISRISSMVEKLCTGYGSPLGVVDDEEYFSFPPLEALAADSVEQELRELGFGYRAKYINKSAKFILEQNDPHWLDKLRTAPYKEAKSELMQLCGVGAKVADCVCLMSLDKAGAIPVDTHVWQIAMRDYMKKLKSAKSLTDTIYKEIGDYFRSLWGEYAGWAHSVLFSADLRKFQDLKKKSQKKASPKRPTCLTDENDAPKPKQRRTRKK